MGLWLSVHGHTGRRLKWHLPHMKAKLFSHVKTSSGKAECVNFLKTISVTHYVLKTIFSNRTCVLELE